MNEMNLPKTIKSKLAINEIRLENSTKHALDAGLKKHFIPNIMLSKEPLMGLRPVLNNGLVQIKEKPSPDEHSKNPRPFNSVSRLLKQTSYPTRTNSFMKNIAEANEIVNSIYGKSFRRTGLSLRSNLMENSKQESFPIIISKVPSTSSGSISNEFKTQYFSSLNVHLNNANTNSNRNIKYRANDLDQVARLVQRDPFSDSRRLTKPIADARADSSKKRGLISSFIRFNSDNHLKSSALNEHKPSFLQSNSKTKNELDKDKKYEELKLPTSSTGVSGLSSASSQAERTYDSLTRSQFTCTNPAAISEFSYFQDPNHNYRPSMEDMSYCVGSFNKGTSTLLTLYDGHGGAEVARYCKDNFPRNFLAELKGDVEASLKSAFSKTDAGSRTYLNSGSTALVVYIVGKSQNERVLYCANLGDTRAVMISQNSYKRLSKDHKGTESDEIKRVISSGGSIQFGRVLGELMVTRAYGDHRLKKHGVIAIPTVSVHTITEKDKWLVMASDGVWDVIEDSDLVGFSLCVKTSEEFSRYIVKMAYFRGSRDNISCIVGKL